MQIPVYNINGEEVDQIEVSEDIFNVPFNEALVHQVMVGQQANARQGNASTKTRSEVKGSSRKLFRQKGTGSARAGQASSPTRRGGGVAFGPKPRSYRQATPKKMRRHALKCVLSAKARENELTVLDKFDFSEPKTKEMARILSTLGIDKSALVVTSELDVNMVKSTRNLVKIKPIPTNLLNVVDILSHRKLLMTVPAVRKAEELWGQKSPDGDGNEPVRDTAPPADN